MALETQAQDVGQAWDQRSVAWRGVVRRTDYQRRQEALLDLIQRHSQPCQAVDVGCGSGELSRALLNLGYDAYGSDVSPAMVAAAREGVRSRLADADVRFRLPDHRAVPFEGPFGLVTAIGVFPYVSDYRAMVAELDRVTAPGGLVVATCTHRFSLFGVWHLAGRLLRPSLSAIWWRQTRAFLHTGLWSGGDLDYRQAKQVYSARAFDALFAERGFRLVDSIDLFNLGWLDRRLTTRSAVGRWWARRAGWVHRGFYRREASLGAGAAGRRP